MVSKTNTAWESFIEKTLLVAQELDDDDVSLKDALNRIMDSAPGVAPEVEEFILNTFSEIDSSPEEYEEAIALLRGKPSQQEVKKFMERPT